MSEIPEKYLPIGTVVLLKGAKKRLMITGFATVIKEDDKMWDYCGCMFPEGIMTLENTCLFDHEQIEKIYHMGLSEDEDEEEKEFFNSLKDFMKNSDVYLDTKK